MAGRAGSLHAAMIHTLHSKRRGAAVAQGTLVPGHSGRGNGRNVIGWFRCHIGIGAAMTGLAGSGYHAVMIEGRRQPAGKAMVA